MRTVSYRLVDLNNATLNLGFVGENEHTRVIFDSKKMFEQYPDAVVSLTVRPPVGDAYPAVTVRDGDLVIWDVADTDLATQGMGEVQLAFTEDGKVAKSYKAKTRIAPSILPTGEIPSPVDDWLTRANATLAEVDEAIPAGGTAGQVLAKRTDADRDLEWVNQSGGGGGTDNYNSLTNKPKINGHTLAGNVSLADIGALSAETLATAIATALAQAKASGEFDGADGQDGADGVGIASIAKTGTSGLVDTYTITLTSGSTYTFTVTNGQDGAPGQDGSDGAPGADGYSPSASVSKSSKTATITITDKNGTTTATVSDGENGQDGQDGEDGQDGFSPTVTVTTITGGHRVTITDAQGAHTFDVMDGSGGGSVTVDDELSDTSTNPVQNKVITGEVSSLREAIE